MVDNFDILYTAGTGRFLEPLQRMTPGIPVMNYTKPWEGLFGYVSPHVVDDKQLYLYYQCYNETSAAIGAAGHHIGVCLAISEDDGETWEKPGDTSACISLRFLPHGDHSFSPAALLLHRFRSLQSGQHHGRYECGLEP